MKKMLKSHWPLLLIFVVCVLGPAIIWYSRSGLQVDLKPQCHFQIFRLKPYYESWALRWCHGWQYINGKEKHHYHVPVYSHVNMKGWWQVRDTNGWIIIQHDETPAPDR